jgi:hypothetical protein
MSSPTLVSAVVLLFCITALLYYQSSYRKEYEGFVPADLHKAPFAVPSSVYPSSIQRPVGIPGAIAYPTEPRATFAELQDVDTKIVIWLESAAQRENENPAGLTHAQRQNRILLQARLACIRNQMGTGLITDSAKTIREEAQQLRKENVGWQKHMALFDLDAVQAFAKGANPNAPMSSSQYDEFRALFDAGLRELKGYVQPDPLQKVRTQQLQLLSNDLLKAEHTGRRVPIQVSVAKLFLLQMMQADQPLPSLYTSVPCNGSPSLSSPSLSSPTDVLQHLQDIQWKLTIQYNPGEQQLLRSLSSLMNTLRQSHLPPDCMDRIRTHVSHFRNQDLESSLSSESTSNYIERARVLCTQIKEAFPDDATALGCPATSSFTDETDAQNTIGIVCDRIRYSVPTVSPNQFQCPSS